MRVSQSATAPGSEASVSVAGCNVAASVSSTCGSGSSTSASSCPSGPRQWVRHWPLVSACHCSANGSGSSIQRAAGPGGDASGSPACLSSHTRPVASNARNAPPACRPLKTMCEVIACKASGSSAASAAPSDATR